MRLFVFISILLLFACKKNEQIQNEEIIVDENVPETHKPLTFQQLIFSHNPVSLGQEVTITANITEDLVADFAWKLYFDGILIQDLNFDKNNKLTLSPEKAGVYKIEIYSKFENRTGTLTHTLEVIENDFIVGAWGQSDSVIIATKLRINGISPTKGLIGFSWPFTSPKPKNHVRYQLSATRSENYLFDENNKLIAGFELINNANFVQNMGGIDRNLSYGHYLEFSRLMDRLVGEVGTETMHWREGFSEEKIQDYLNFEPNIDGIGWALLNRDLSYIEKHWITDRYEGYVSIKASSDNRKYILLSIVKDANY